MPTLASAPTAASIGVHPQLLPASGAGRVGLQSDMHEFDLIVIGTCANRGCDAKKPLVHAADVLADARVLSGRGLPELPPLDWPALSRLETVGHIESVDTWYSKKVIETDGYAPIYAPLMIG